MPSKSEDEQGEGACCFCLSQMPACFFLPEFTWVFVLIPPQFSMHAFSGLILVELLLSRKIGRTLGVLFAFYLGISHSVHQGNKREFHLFPVSVSPGSPCSLF